MNDSFLILEGGRAASWLAMRGRKIGLKAPARYDQGEEGSIFKVSHELCIVNGFEIKRKVEQDWSDSVPDGIVLHRPASHHRAVLTTLMQQEA